MADRIPNTRFSEPIFYGLRLFEPFLSWLPAVRFVCADPIFVGLHSIEDISDGRSYRDTAHTSYPFHLNGPRSRRLPTIVLPVPEVPKYVVHELAHVLDYALGFSHKAVPVSAYAKVNRREAFAEAVTAYLVPGYAKPVEDRSTAYLFESLTV